MFDEIVILGKKNIQEIDNLLKRSQLFKSIGRRISLISAFFLDTPYQENTLIGNITIPEKFIVNLGAVDCMTFLEYVEAMRLSGTFNEFKERLKCIRYKGGEVSFSRRNHFFTDWFYNSDKHVQDITHIIGKGKTISVEKRLNLKGDGTFYLEGVSTEDRKLNYIPSLYITKEIIQRLKSGDYIGVYTDKKGLDVSHVGILIKKEGKIFLRHASSDKAYRRVVDQEFKSYITKMPGIIIMRPVQEVQKDEAEDRGSLSLPQSRSLP